MNREKYIQLIDRFDSQITNMIRRREQKSVVGAAWFRFFKEHRKNIIELDLMEQADEIRCKVDQYMKG